MTAGTKELRSSLLEIENIADNFFNSISEINNISQEVKSDVYRNKKSAETKY